jgi:hypothetical protein
MSSQSLPDPQASKPVTFGTLPLGISAVTEATSEAASSFQGVDHAREAAAATTGRSSYQVNTSGFVDSFGNITASSNVSGVSNSVTQYIDKTRPSLNTNMEGLLLKMSADGDIDTHRLVNDLRESGSVYYNVKLAFGNLQAAYPGDLEITRTVAAMDRLMAEKTTSVDAMRQLKKFVEYARSKK